MHLFRVRFIGIGPLLLAALLAFSSGSIANPAGFIPLPDDNGGTVAQGINDAGHIVGGSDGSFLYSGGNFTNFNVPPANISAAFGINDQGQIVGGYELPGAIGRAYVGTPAAVTTIIPPGSIAATAFGINNAGVIVGGAYYPGTPSQGFIDNAGNFTTFDVPGASTALSGINQSGDLAGYYVSGGATTGFSTDANRNIVLTVPGGQVSGINNAGQIVGWIGNSGFVDTSGAIQYINVDGASFSRVSGINNTGQIVGYYGTSSGEHSFLATLGVDLDHFPGGHDPMHPMPLPDFHLIGSVSDTIPAPFLGDWYEFRWPGNTSFDAIANVTGAPPDAVYTVRLNCVTLVGAQCEEPPPSTDWTLDALDGFTADIDFLDFFTGTWEIGIFGGPPTDPEFTIDFVTPVEGVPVEGVPEPASIAILAAGLLGLTWIRPRRVRSLARRRSS